MRIETIEDLMNVIQSLYPVSFTAKQLPVWTERYRSALSDLSSDELNAAWVKIGETWTKKSAPSPADILAAHRSLTPLSQPKDARSFQTDIKAELAAKAFRLREIKRQIADEYAANHPKTYGTAQAEGWTNCLVDQVKRAAHLLSQRRQKSDAGIPLIPLDEYTCTELTISVNGNSEAIEIPRAMIERWRTYALERRVKMENAA